MILQLNPTIPVYTEKGNGYAIAWIDYSQEHSLQWVVALNDSGEVWSFPNEKIRFQKNISMNRLVSQETHFTGCL